jgi:hypothetical protein
MAGQGMAQEADDAVAALGRPDFSEGQSRVVVDGSVGDVMNHASRAMPAQVDDSLGCAARDHRGQAMWLRATAGQARGPSAKKRCRHLLTVLRSMTLTSGLDATANGRAPPAYRT